MHPFRGGSGHPTSACILAGMFTRLSKGKVLSGDSLSARHHEDSQRVPQWPPSSYTGQGRRTAAYSRSAGTARKTRSCAAVGDPGWALGQGRLLPQPLGRILGVLTCWGAPSPPRTPAQGSSGESLLPSEEGTQGKKQSALAYKFITSDGFQE